MAKGSRKLAYVVRRGRVPGIYYSWDECNAQVHGFSGGQQQGYYTIEAARQAWMAWTDEGIRKTENGTPEEILPLGQHHYPENQQRTPKLKRTASAIESFDVENLEPATKKWKREYSSEPDEDSPPEQGNISINEEQETVVQMALNRHNIFLTGAAGSGKTVTLKEIIKRFKSRDITCQVVAPTGIAAMPLGGKTTYSFLGWKPDSLQTPIKDLTNKSKVKKYIRKAVGGLKVLIIEEISMVENQFLERMNLLFQAIRENDKPFGGVQIILVGDFYQLPPVKPFDFCLQCGKGMLKGSDFDIKCLNCESSFEGSDKWAFKAPVWQSLNLKDIHLRQIHRQESGPLLEILFKIRNGIRLTNAEWDELEREKIYPDGLWAIRLMSLRKDVENINLTELSNIKDKPESWKATDLFSMKDSVQRKKGLTPWVQHDPLKDHRLNKTLVLKKGAKVILLVNRPQDGLVNGSQGTVIGFEERDVKLEAHKRPRIEKEQIQAFHANESQTSCRPIVRFANDVKLTITPVAETSTHGTNQAPYLATRVQIPLALAWALSIHKSQGMTLEYLQVSNKDLFEPGQLYVGLSRATHLEGLQVGGDVREQLELDSDVLSFYENTKWETLDATKGQVKVALREDADIEENLLDSLGSSDLQELLADWS